MKNNLLFFGMRYAVLLCAAAALLSSCASTQKAADKSKQADMLYFMKEYDSAFAVYSDVIESYVAKKQQVPGQLYSSAGKCLYYTGSRPQAMEYFTRAEEQGVADEQMLYLRVKYYGDIDNLSKEVDYLEQYSALYPQGADISFVNERLFLRYAEMQEYRKAYLKYQKMSASGRDSVPILEQFYQVCRKVDKDDEAAMAAEKLYSIDNSNLVGLNHVAYQAYITTENEYVAAIKAYEAKKTNAAYAALQKQTAPLLARYRKARDLYLKLYAISKKPFDASILSRIYSRLSDKAKSDYYAKLAKKQ